MRKLWMLALASCLALPAGAGDFLVGGAAGQATIEIDSAGFDESDTGFKVFGGWRLLKFLGLEGGYVDFGGPTMSTGGVEANAEVTAWDAFAMGVVPFGKLEVFGKAGLVMWDAEATVSTPGLRVTQSTDGTDLAAGARAAALLLPAGIASGRRIGRIHACRLHGAQERRHDCRVAGTARQPRLV